MNRIFKILWNFSTHTFVVVSEQAKNRGKKSGRRKLLLATLVGGSSLLALPGAQATGNEWGTFNGPTLATDGWIALGRGAAAGGPTGGDGASTAVGYNANATPSFSTAVGALTYAGGMSSTALGVKASSSGDRAIAVGASSTAAGSYSMALGVLAKVGANAENSIALGRLTDVTAKNAVALGNGSTATTDNTVSVGSDMTKRKIVNMAQGDVSEESTEAINGSQLYQTNKDLLTLETSVDALNEDALLWDTGLAAFSASHGGVAAKITNVAAGSVSADSSDAVNGGQLYGVSSSIAASLGGNSTVNADGSVSAPSYSIGGEDYSNIGDALSAIGGSAAAQADEIKSLQEDALLWDGMAFNASHGGVDDNKITHVAEGALAAGSTDAVNGGQLFAANQAISQNATIITNLVGDTSQTFISEHGVGIKYIRTNAEGLVDTDAHASGTGATAVGYNASATGEGSLALGKGSFSSVDTGIALGSGSLSDRIIAAGSRGTTINNGTLNIGYDTTDRTLLGALSLGIDGQSYRQIINVADGTELQDAVTLRQLQNAVGAVLVTNSQYFHANSTLGDSLAVGANAIAVGPQTVVNGDAGIGIGYGASVDQIAGNGVALGTNAKALHADSVALGNDSQTTVGSQENYKGYNLDADQSSAGEISVGSEGNQRQITNVAAGSSDTDAVNVAQLKVTDSRVAQNTQNISALNTQIGGLDARVTNIESSIGDIVSTGNTKYFKTNSTGADANAQGEESLAAGSRSQASGVNSIAIGGAAQALADNSVSLGAASEATASNSVALGANSVADEADTVSVGSKTQQRRVANVAAGKNATDAVNVAQLKSSESGGVRYGLNDDGTVNYDFVALGDGSGGTSRIGNVSAAVNDNDAVNYAQLKQSIQDTNNYTDQRMNAMSAKVNRVERKLSGGVASAMAMTGLPQAYTPGASMASLAGGTYHGESAVAMGVSMVSANGRWVYKLHGSTNSQGDYSVAVGAGIQW